MSDRQTNAVLVVHGIGGYAPGSAVSSFAQLYAEVSGGRLHRSAEIFDPDRAFVSPVIETSGPHSWIQTVSTDTTEIHFGEVNWNDKSRLARGPFSALRNFLHIAFKLPILARAVFANGSHKPSIWRFVLSLLSKLIIFTVERLVLATNIVFAAIALTYYLLAMSHPQQFTLASPALDLVLVVTFAIALSCLLLRWWTKEPLLKGTLLSWTMFASVVVILAVVGRAYIEPARPLLIGEVSLVFIEILKAEWLIVHAFSLIFAITALLIWLVRRKYRFSVELSFVVLFLVVRAWLVFISTFWVYGISVIREVKPDLIDKAIEEQIREGLVNLFVVWIDCAVVLLIFTVAGLQWYLWSRSLRRESENIRIKEKSGVPRIIYPRLLFLYGVLSTLVWNATILILLVRHPDVAPSLPSEVAKYISPAYDVLKMISDEFIDGFLVIAPTGVTVIAAVSFLLRFVWKVVDDILFF